ncbi:MAG: replication endonuclease, partial [Bacteroidales bacterium]|nr:replication endonuclease [Bacteroidales bacterium]
MKNDYGLNSFERDMTIKKLKHQQKYLFENGISANGVQIPYANFFKNAWHNSNRYIAELNHRIYSLNEYANEKGLSPIFAVITLPSEYHRLKTIKLKNGKLKLVNNPKYINDKEHNIKAGNRKLQSVVRNIFNQRAFRNIAKDDKCYLTTREPHKDGTPHLNLLCFVPKEKVKDCVKAIKNNFLDTHSRVETAINNPTAYIMKYIFKTLDDLRGNNDNLDNLSNLTLWYIHHKIPRVTMSRTFV